MKQIIELVWIKIKDINSIINDLRLYDTEMIFNAISKNEKDILLSDLKLFLEKCKINFMEEDLLFIIEDFKTNSKIKISQQEFQLFINDFIWSDFEV